MKEEEVLFIYVFMYFIVFITISLIHFYIEHHEEMELLSNLRIKVNSIKICSLITVINPYGCNINTGLSLFSLKRQCTYI